MGGNEPPLVNGHLSGGEPIVKPTHKGRFLYFIEEVIVIRLVIDVEVI